VQAVAAKLRARGLPVRAHLRCGGPALVLADVAAEGSARLVGVSAGEPGKLACRLVGSVADLVAERSPCDVLIVRPSDLG
jgi:nucleotide-binding universal stress UspA family protein